MTKVSTVKVDAKIITRIVSKNFCNVGIESISRMPYAFTNKIFLIELNKSPYEIVLKIANKNRIAKLRSETELIEMLSSITELPVAKVIYTDFNCHEFPFPLVIYSYLYGENLVDAIEIIENKDLLGYEIAGIALNIHKLKFPSPKSSFTNEILEKSWKEIINVILSDSLKSLKAVQYKHIKTLEHFITHNMSLIIEPKEYSLVHRDLQPQNMLWKDNKITGVFDFESALAGDLHFEFCFLEYKLFRLYPETKRAFYKRYATEGNLRKDYEQLVKFYCVIRDMYYFYRNMQIGELQRAKDNISSLETQIKEY